jgi:hypothetical protein
MKKTSLLLLVAGTFVAIQAQTITKEFLTKSDFIIDGEPMFNLTLQFNSNNSYTMTLGIEGDGWMDSGSYQIKNNAVYLHCLRSDSAVFATYNPDYEFTAGNCVANVTTSETDLKVKCLTRKKKDLIPFSDQYIATIPVPGSEVPVGTLRTVNGIEIFTTGEKRTITTDNVKIRDQPSLAGKTLTFLSGYYDGEKFPWVPKKTEVILIGRTKEKEIIGKYEDYWYYVEVGANYGVWMYGAFFDLNYQPKEEN